MTKDQFIRNMRGIDNGLDLPTEYLSKLFDRIVAEEMMTDVARRGCVRLFDHPPFQPA